MDSLDNTPNPPAEPAYSAPQPEVVEAPAPEGSEKVEPTEQVPSEGDQPEEHDHNEDVYDTEVGTAEDIQADFDTEEVDEEDDTQ